MASPVLNIAHRGASAYAPENTIAAFDLAVELGADALELDVRMTSDGVLVAFHDAVCARTLCGPGEPYAVSIPTMTYEDLSALDAGSWFNRRAPGFGRREYAGLCIPTLEQVFLRYRDKIGFFIELKVPGRSPGMEEEVVRLIDACRLPYQGDAYVAVASFSSRSLRKVGKLAPGIHLVQLVARGERAIMAKVEKAAGYADAVGVWRAHLDLNTVLEAHWRDLDVVAYTVNEATDMTGMISCGVDGVITDFPDRLGDLLATASRLHAGHRPGRWNKSRSLRSS